MKLKNNTIHVWTGSLAISEQQADKYQKILSDDEQNRANRFQFASHRLHYIAAHYQLRQILAKYTGREPTNIQFGFGEHKKPFLTVPDDTDIQFNISHSSELAVFAFGLTFPLGIDVEKVQDKFNFDIADRFFSKKEAEELSQFSNVEKRIAFYRVWSRKEALIKATGKGMSQSLPSFSVTARDITETVNLSNEPWQLRPISVDSGYQAALACHPSIEDIDIFSFDEMVNH